MKKIVASLAAAGILVAGAFATAAVAGPGSAVAQEAETDAPESDRPTREGVLDSVLSDLVADGTLNQSQADAVKEAIKAKAEELSADRPSVRERRMRDFKRGVRIGALLEDGVIDAEELAQFPEGHPLTNPDGPAGPYLEDGQLTIDELRELREQHRQQRDAATDAPSTDA